MRRLSPFQGSLLLSLEKWVGVEIEGEKEEEEEAAEGFMFWRAVQGRRIPRYFFLKKILFCALVTDAYMLSCLIGLITGKN